MIRDGRFDEALNLLNAKNIPLEDVQAEAFKVEIFLEKGKYKEALDLIRSHTVSHGECTPYF